MKPTVGIQIIRESHGSTTDRLLSEAWSSRRSFVIIPRKINLRDSDITAAIDLIPEEYHTDCFTLLTSGSTGVPKFVLGRKDRSEKLAAVLHQIQDAADIQESVVVLPLSYSFAFVNQWLWARVNKRRLILTDGFSNATDLRARLEQSEDAMICLVGAQIPLMKQCFGDSQKFPGIKRIHFAGGRFPQPSLGYIRNLFPEAQIYNNYGCVEAMPRLTIRRADDAEDANNIGMLLPGIEMRAEADRKVVFRSPYGAVGLVEQDAFVHVDNETWLPSGDYGEQNADGSWSLHGRTSDVFKRYGEKVSTVAISDSLLQRWDGEVAFYQEQDSNGEQGYVLVVTPPPNDEVWRAMLRQLRINFSRAHWPLRLESVESFPLLPSGKVNLQVLSSLDGRTTHWRQRI